MSTQMRGLLAGGFDQLRHEPTAKRIRAVLGGATVLDSTRGVLVWEPRRIVPSYARPAGMWRWAVACLTSFRGCGRRVRPKAFAGGSR